MIQDHEQDPVHYTTSNVKTDTSKVKYDDIMLVKQAYCTVRVPV